MKKRGLVFLPVVFILGLLLPTTVFANYGQCGTIAGDHSNPHTGIDIGNTFHGVRSYITPGWITTSFGPCQGGLITYQDYDGPAGYVALYPTTCGTGCNSSHAIVQVGVIDCHTYGVYSNPACTNGANGKDQYFVGWGGCNGAKPIAQKVLNGTNPIQHKYWIEIDNGFFVMYVDSTQVATVALSDSDISCWANGQLSIEMSGEKLDVGDSLGDHISGGNLDFDSMTYKSATTNNWIHFNIRTGACGFIDSRDNCFLYSTDPGYTDGMEMWTSQ